MILINSDSFDTFANVLGACLFILIVIWAFWFASKMD